jgi:four helix bundle protein
MQDYRNLRVFRKAHEHTLSVRRATHRFPRTGYSDFKSQIIRAVESIVFNIVEGCGASTQKEFARFLDISIKSSNELEYQLSLAKDYEILEDADWKPLNKRTVDIRRMLCGLRATVLGLEDPSAD